MVAHDTVLGMCWVISLQINCILGNKVIYTIYCKIILAFHPSPVFEWKCTLGKLLAFSDLWFFCLSQTFLTQALGILIQMHLMSITVLMKLFMGWSLTLYLMSKEQSWFVTCHQTSCPDLWMYPRYSIGHGSCTEHLQTLIFKWLVTLKYLDGQRCWKVKLRETYFIVYLMADTSTEI